MTCGLVASSDGKTSAVTKDITVIGEPAAPPTVKCSLASGSRTAAAFSGTSATVSSAARRSVLAATGSGCTGSFVVTGYAKASKSKAKDTAVARARAQALVSVLKAQHPLATFSVATAVGAKAKGCASAAQNRCAVIQAK